MIPPHLMPDTLELDLTSEEVITNGAKTSPFWCPIARRVRTEFGPHEGVTRKTTLIYGIAYIPQADAIRFMDAFDAHGRATAHKLTFPYRVTFKRKRFS